jgi:lysophospholipase L1-like esterase
VSGLLLAASLLPLHAQAPAGPQSGQKVAFLGDSITQFGFQNPGGYVNLVGNGMTQVGRPITVIPAGVSGNTSRDMLARFKRDVLDKKPDWMTLSCGVNDVWHGVTGVDLPTYKTNITSIVDQATAAGIKVVILTSTMISEDPAAGNNQKLAAYNDFLRGLARERNLPLADLNAEMQAELAEIRAANPPKGNLLTVDGVHMNGLGNEMMAAGVLKAFGFSDAQLAQVRDKWLDLTGGMIVPASLQMTVRQFLQLQALGRAQSKTPADLLNAAVQKDVADLTASAPPPPPPALTTSATVATPPPAAPAPATP